MYWGKPIFLTLKGGKCKQKTKLSLEQRKSELCQHLLEEKTQYDKNVK